MLTVHCFTVNLQTLFRCLKQVLKHSSIIFGEASAAGFATFLRLASIDYDRLLTTAVVRVVNTVFYTTIQFCHEYFLLICFILGSKVFLPL